MPFTARYPQNRLGNLQRQNSGIAALTDKLQQLNAGIAARGPVAPYQQSMGAGGLEGYAAGLANGGGLMTNQQAQQNYGVNGYMPNRTVGGAFGQPIYGPNSPGYGQAVANDQYMYRTGQIARPGQVPTGLSAFGNNMGGRFYGGATPQMVSTAAGMRPGFVSGLDHGANTSFAGTFPAQNYARNAQGALTPINRGLAGGAPQASMAGMGGIPGLVAGGASAAGPAGGLVDLAANRQAYQQRQADNRQSVLNRVGLRQQNAVNAQQAAMEAANPQYGLAAASLRAQQGIAQGRLGLQQQALAQQGQLAQQQFAQQGLDRDQKTQLANLQMTQQNLQRQHDLALQQGNYAHAQQLANLAHQNALALQSGQQQGLLAVTNAQNQGRVQALEAARNPMDQANGLVGIVQKLQDIADRNPAMAKELLPLLPGLQGAAGGQTAGGGQGLGGLASYFGNQTLGPVAAQRGLAAGGNSVLNDAVGAMGQHVAGVPQNSTPETSYGPLFNLASQLKQLESQGHITSSNKAHVAAALKGQMPQHVMDTLGQVNDQRLNLLGGIGASGTPASYLRNFFGVPQPKQQNPGQQTMSPYYGLMY